QMRLLYQNGAVLFIGTSGAPQAGETKEVSNPGSGLITFAAPQDAAQRIVLASQGDGGIYLTLVPRTNKPVASPPVVTNDNLFATGLTPCGNDKSCSEQ